MYPRYSAAIGVALLTMLARSSASPSTTTVTQARPVESVVTPTSTFSWPGVYDLIGSGFEEGERRAVMEIAKKDTSYALVSLTGPPGSATTFQIAGDRAHIVWDLGTDVMYVDLRGTGDSLAGEWFVGDETGQIRGARRR